MLKTKTTIFIYCIDVQLSDLSLELKNPNLDIQNLKKCSHLVTLIQYFS